MNSNIDTLIVRIADALTSSQEATDAYDELLRILLLYQDFALQFDQWWELQGKPPTARNAELGGIQWVHVLSAYAQIKGLAGHEIQSY